MVLSWTSFSVAGCSALMLQGGFFLPLQNSPYFRQLSHHLLTYLSPSSVSLHTIVVPRSSSFQWTLLTSHPAAFCDAAMPGSSQSIPEEATTYGVSHSSSITSQRALTTHPVCSHAAAARFDLVTWTPRFCFELLQRVLDIPSTTWSLEPSCF